MPLSLDPVFNQDSGMIPAFFDQLSIFIAPLDHSSIRG